MFLTSLADHDPEADGAADQNSNVSDSDDSEAENVGTEHYVTVGKSKLREKEPAALGPHYRGSRVSRDALEDSGSEEDSEADDDDEAEDDEDGGHYADPDLVDLEADEAEASDSEIDSDNALGESDAERLKDFTFRGSAKPRSTKGRRASAADYMSSEDDDEDEGGADLSAEEDDEDDDSDEDMEDGLDDLVNGGASGSDDIEEDEDSESDNSDEVDENEDEKKLSNGKSSKTNGDTNKNQSTGNAETQKGLAIQQQRKTYDGLLNMRIRLQKALVAANTFSTLSADADDNAEPYTAAEEAAVNLLNTMSSLRNSFKPSGGAGSKRKREFDTSTSSGDIWADMESAESQFSKQRKELLEKWSRKTQGGASKAADARMSAKGGRKPLTSALRDQLNDPEGRLIKRTKVPRSCAPTQAAQRVPEDDAIYDDADFYQMLLKELVDQRTVESSSTPALGPTVMLSAAKDAKTRRDVDRKASKGRKMRFTVHEKLQNFMAPEDRRNWEPAAIDRLFGTLFGQKLGLNEDDEMQSDEDDAEVDVSGLRLFG